MESLSLQVVAAVKLPILNLNEFDLWKMRIEQYFLMTVYSLWEVILNGDSPIPTRVIDGVVQPITPTTAEQRLAKKNELKARGTLLMALPDKHQLKFNIHKDAKSLMEAIEKSFGVSLTKSVNVVPSVTAASTKVLIFALSNVDNLSDAVFASDELTSFESDVSVPTSPVHNRYKSGEWYHAVHPSYTGIFMPSKPDLVFHDASTVSEIVPSVFNVQPSPIKPTQEMSQSTRTSTLIIEGWVSDSEDESEGKSTKSMEDMLHLVEIQRRVPKENNMYNVDLKNIVPLGDLTCLFVKATLDESNLWHKSLGHINFKTMNKLVKDPLGKFDRKANEGFLVGYSVSSKAFRVFNSRTIIVQETLHINFLENQPNVAESGHGIQENLVACTVGKEPVFTQQYVLLPLWSPGLKDPQNSDVNVAFANKENESEVYVSLSSSDKTKKHNAKAKKKSSRPDALVTAVGPNSTTSTTSFNDVGPSNTVVSPNFDFGRKSSYVDLFPYPDDPDMSALEEIVYFDDEEDVDAEDDFFNLETSITEEGIDYEEVFAQVAMIEAIRLFLAYASFLGFMVYQMDVKSAFFYGTIKEEVYVCQHPGFEDLDYPDKNGFQREKIDQTLFIKKQKVDERQVPDEFNGELTFFLGLQVKQKKDRIFISQDKYVAEILRKFGLTEEKSASTPIDTEKPLLKDPDGEDVDVHTYRSMIGSLMYLTSSRPDIMFAVYACANFQVTLKVSYLHAVKRIFRYLKGKPHLGLWYPKGSPFNLVAYSDSDYAGASLDRKSTTGDGIDCLPKEKIFAELARMGYKKPSTKLTFYKAFFSTQWKFLIHIILQCMSAKRTVWNEFSSSMASAVICLATVGDLSFHNTKYTSSALTQKVFANMRRIRKGFSRVDTPLFDAPPQQQPSHTTDILMSLLSTLLETCVTLTKQVSNLEQDKVAQAIKITKLKQMVKRLEKKRQFKSLGGCIQTGGKIAKLDADEDVTLEEVDAKVAMDADDTDETEPAKVKEVVTGAKLMTEVVTTAATTITVAQVPKASAPRKMKVEEPKPLKRQAQIEQDEAFAKELEVELNANINWDDVMEQVKRKEKQDNTRRFRDALEACSRKISIFRAKEFLDDFLLNTLKTMFKKPNVEASIWRDQRGRYRLAKVKSWKLLESCRVHILTLTTTQMILLVEKKYPLTRFTLE
uniref:Retrovirus-related Pol polyprotein from transposon TNT 1-94 n=1 Tax=Tanacetum cinerariifolium TaxID=118510 RepID=A0A6L2KKY1_TANCI|nr:retrovirus-related Pol polyprotein from transposon TNT 1-94 [Tanacetum cinerariifolium]